MRNSFRNLQWWELRRFYYNLIILVCGYLSIQIATISIPLFYILFGIALNIGYSLNWLLDNALKKNRHAGYSNALFISYVILSILLIFGFSLSLVFR